MKDDERAQLRTQFGVTASDENGYAMPEARDYQILAAVKALESRRLSVDDSELVELIRSQLLDDWRAPLLRKLEALRIKYD